MVIAVQAHSARWASMPPHGSALRHVHAATRLAGERGINAYYSLPGTCRLESADGEEPAPAGITDALGAVMVLHSVGAPQMLVKGAHNGSNRSTRCPAPGEQTPRRAVGASSNRCVTTAPVRATSSRTRRRGPRTRVSPLGALRRPNAAPRLGGPPAWRLGAKHVVATPAASAPRPRGRGALAAGVATPSTTSTAAMW